MQPEALRICVIDDDQDVLRAVRRLLRTSGFTADTYTSAEEWLNTGSQPSPDCLVLDVHLRGLSGFELQDRLRASGHSIPTVFVTAHDDEATRERAVRAGASEYLRKPFEDHALIEAIHQVVGRGYGRAAP